MENQRLNKEENEQTSKRFRLNKHLEIIFSAKFAENIVANFQKGVDFMSRQASSVIKSAAAGIAVGGATFAAVKYFSDNRRLRRKTAAKAAKLIGSFMDMM